MSVRVGRLSSGGRIDRRRVIRFRHDGRERLGFAGDTLASALLAGGQWILARSFKYHRPRGILSAGVEEPNALFTLGKGGCTTTNVSATTTPLHEGLEAATQNAWPSAGFDLGAVNSWFAPLLGAGFYYKTFMGPRRGSWMFYEPFIRRAAGLGRAVHERDPDRYDTGSDHADVLVIGSGPAGLSAALAAGEAGARTLLVDQDVEFGGSLLAASPARPVEGWRLEILRRLAALGNVRMQAYTTALGLYDGNTVALIERRDHLRPDASRGEAREVLTTLHAKAIVFATGAIERPLLFANNDRPGILLASAARSYLNRHAVLAGKRVVVATNNDSAWQCALDFGAAGAEVTLIEQRRSVDAGLVSSAGQAGVDLRLASVVARAIGARKVRAVEIRPRDGGKAKSFACDLLCVSGGWSPAVQLTSHAGVKPVYREDLDALVPGVLPATQLPAGAVTGEWRREAAMQQGRQAGLAAAAAVAGGMPSVLGGAQLASGGDAPAAIADSSVDNPFDHCVQMERAMLPVAARGKVFVDLQTDVTAADVETAHQEGFEALEHLKRYTTLGMGTEQGKGGAQNAIGLMAELRGIARAEAGTTTFRPPYTPVSVGALAGRSTGLQFRPIRRSPLHDWHLAHGAVMTEAGQWLRPLWYRWAGEDVAAASAAEMQLVRTAVGISDVSTLGKIDVQGPDAAEFLDRVYVNGFAQLPVGKARYGVMLNDDGSVLDDGTTTRLSQNRFFMTTTTAQAAEVMSWLEFLLQAAWRELAVQVTSLTDEWAGMSVAGPKARAALASTFPEHDFSDAVLPHMGSLEFDHAGVPVRVLRLSFSGELAYELYVPAGHGVALWEHLLDSAAPLGIKPYGLESLASLRIEKGHVAGLELDHRTTLDDLGLGRMASTRKAFVGRELRQRPVLQAPERWSLVGIECLDEGARLRGGAILFAAGETIEGHGRGYITSVTWSPTLGKYIALGLYNGGLRHQGEEIICAFPLRGEQARARIVSPVFLDVEGARLRV